MSDDIISCYAYGSSQNLFRDLEKKVKLILQYLLANGVSSQSQLDPLLCKCGLLCLSTTPLYFLLMLSLSARLLKLHHISFPLLCLVISLKKWSRNVARVCSNRVVILLKYKGLVSGTTLYLNWNRKLRFSRSLNRIAKIQGP